MSAKIWVLLAIVNVARSRDIIVGSNDIGHKIYDENKHAGAAIWRQSENVTITANDTEVISKIVVTDLRAEKDGDAKIVEGGEGQRNVTIELKSPTVLRGYEFHIEAYAVAEDQLKTMGQKSENIETNKLKEQSSTTTPVDKQLITTVALPTNKENVNRRENRDTKNKDKSTQEIKNATSSLGDSASTTEISKVPLGHTLTSTYQKPDQKFPTVNREFQQGNDFDHPRFNIYEVNKTPESTTRSIPSANLKPEENINTEGPLNSESNTNDETNLNTDKMYTHISYPQFGADPKQEHAVNTALPIVEDNNKNKRHRRDVTKPIEERSNPKPLGEDKKATSETNPLNSPVQKHDEEHVLGGYVGSGTVVPSSSYNPSSLEKQNDQDSAVKSQHANNESHQHTAFRNRHIHRRFGNTAANAPSPPSSTENNKISTPLPKINDSTQTGDKSIYTQPRQLGKEQSTSTTPVVTEATTKSGITTGNLANAALEPKVTNTEAEKSHDFNIRHTRDTTIVTNKEISKSLLPPVLRSSSTTLKPETNPKNTQETNVTSSDPQLSYSKSAEDKWSTATDSSQTEEKDRDTRDTIGTNDKKKDKLPNDKKDTLPSITVNPVSDLSEHEPNEHTKTQDSEKTIEPKPKNTENSPKADTTGTVEDMERQARDTSAVDKTKYSKKESSEKTETTKLNKEKANLEIKSFNVDDKLAEHNDNDTQKRVQIPVWNKEDQEEASKINNNEHDNEKDKQTKPKIPREAKETQEPKKSNNGVLPGGISLATDLKIDSTEKPTSIEPKNKENKDKDLKNINSEDSSKPTEKPE